MKTFWKWFWPAVLLGVVLGLGFITAHILTQMPKVWCGRQGIGLALMKDGYRSWSLDFCDGFVGDGTNWFPAVIEGDHYRHGYYRFPRYRHTDMELIMLKMNARPMEAWPTEPWPVRP